jgi:hypothetical protein
MFIQSVFIRKNTPELQEKLRELGYKTDSSTISRGCIATSSICGKYTIINAQDFDSTNPHITWDINGRIDCGYNEELFLALAALRDDTDKNQWFYSTGWTDFEGNPLPDKWVFCDQDTLEHFAWVNNSPNSYKSGWKKATLEEIIKYFK